MEWDGIGIGLGRGYVYMRCWRDEVDRGEGEEEGVYFVMMWTKDIQAVWFDNWEWKRKGVGRIIWVWEGKRMSCKELEREER